MTILEWVKVLEPLSPMAAAERIVDDVDRHRLNTPGLAYIETVRDALIAWAMIAKAED